MRRGLEASRCVTSAYFARSSSGRLVGAGGVAAQPAATAAATTVAWLLVHDSSDVCLECPRWVPPRTSLPPSFPRPQARLRFARGVVAALASVHRAGVMHLDVKADNVLINRDDEERRILLGDLNTVRACHARDTAPGAAVERTRADPPPCLLYSLLFPLATNSCGSGGVCDSVHPATRRRR